MLLALVHRYTTIKACCMKENVFKEGENTGLMDEEEKFLYYGIILACIIGICTTAIILMQKAPPQEEFTELYFYFERIDLSKSGGQFQERTVQISEILWIDINADTLQTPDELFIPGDTFCLQDEFWNISDVAQDNSQILFGKFPKDVPPGEINFTSVIVNHLADIHLYEYTITAEHMTITGSVEIPPGEKARIFEAISVDTSTKVTITLNTGEEIYFYLRVV